MAGNYSQAWTSGAFSQPGSYISSAFGGGDAPIAGYPTVAAAENVETTVGGGPAGENTLDAVDTGNYTDAGIQIVSLGPLTSGQYDARTVTVAFPMKMLTSSLAEAGWGEVITLAAGTSPGTGEGRFRATSFLRLVTERTSGADFTYRLSLQHFTGAGPSEGTELLEVATASGTRDDAWHQFTVTLTPSTITGGFAGTGDLGTAVVASDGSVRVSIDGTPVLDVSGVQFVINAYATAQPDLYYGLAAWFGYSDLPGPIGRVSFSWGTGTTPANDSTPCCGDTVPSGGGGTTPGDVIGQNPNVTLPPWTRGCPGGGTVPGAANVTDAENWRDPALVADLRARLEVERDAGDVQLRLGKKPLPDENSFTEPRVLSYGTIRRSLSDDQGQPEMSTGSVTISINDADEPIRPALAENRSRFISTTEAAIEILSEAGRRIGSVWRSLIRGRVEEPSLTIQRNGLQRSRQAVLPIVDAWAPFYDRVVNDARFLRSNFPNIDRALEGKCIPIIGGEHSDRGAEDVAGNNAEKGLIPGYYVGPWHTVNDDPLSSVPTTYAPPTDPDYTVNGTPGTTTLYYAFTQRNEAGETTLSEILQIDTAPAALNATDSITLDWVSDPLNYTVVYRGRYPTPSRRVKVLAPGVATWTDTGVDPELPPGPPQINTAQIPDADGQFNFWGLVVIGLGDLGDVVPFGSNVAAGVAPARINLTETAGVDMLLPRLPGWLYPTNTLRIGDNDVFCALVRGARLQQHIDGDVTLAFQVCGMRGSDGKSIQQAFPLLQHVLTQFVPTDGGEPWRHGTWKTLREFADGTTTLQPTQFEACQELTKTFLGNDEGYRGAIYIGLEPVTLRDLLQSFDQTFDAFWRVNHHGQGSPFLVNPYADPTAGSPYRERMEISRLGDPILDTASVVKRIAYQYDYDPDAGKYRSEVEIFPAPAPGEAPSTDTRDRGTEQCPWSRDAETVRDAKRRRYYRLKDPRWKVPVTTKLNGLEDELGGQVSLTHRDAPGAGGWTGRPCYVETHEVDLERKEVTLLCVDLLETMETFANLLGSETTTTELLGDETDVGRPLIGAEA